MKLTDFSDTFHVRRLCPEDVENIYALCKANKTYYKYFKTAPTHENIMEDLSRTPPGKTADDKYFLGFFQKDQTLIRHRKSLPVRGQKTKTNARTRKGPRKTVANKKK